MDIRDGGELVPAIVSTQESEQVVAIEPDRQGRSRDRGQEEREARKRPKAKADTFERGERPADEKLQDDRSGGESVSVARKEPEKPAAGPEGEQKKPRIDVKA